MKRKRCWRYDYVIELDVKGLFDNIDHVLLMRVVRRHVKEAWISMYIKRWLKTPFVLRNDTLQCIERRLVKWAMCKYKNLRGHRRRAEKWLLSVRKREPKLFAHWSKMYSYC